MLCFREFPVAKKILDKKVGGGISSFSVEYFLSQSAETIRRGTILCCVSENMWWRKSLWLRRCGEYHNLPLKNFCLTVPKEFVGEPLSLSITSGIKKNYSSHGYVTIFRRKFFVSQYRNNSLRIAEPVCAVFQKISGSEKIFG